MKRLALTLFLLAAALLAANAQTLQYWDNNGTTAGAGSGATWTSSSTTWTTSSGGTLATATWGANNRGRFSAGTDLLGGAYTVTVSGTHSICSIEVEEGQAVTLTGGTLTLVPSGTVTLPRIFTVFGTTSQSIRIDSVLAGTTGLEVRLGAGSVGTVTLGGANTYSGATLINHGSGAAFRNGASEIIPNGSDMTVGSSVTVTWFLDNFSETVNSLAGNASTVNLGSGTLTLNDGAGKTFAGTISGTGGSLTKNGSGSLTLSGTTISASGTLTINTGGAINLTGAGFTLGFTAISIGSGTTLNVNNASGTVIVGGAISGAGSLTKNGVGSLTLSGNNSSFSGGVTFTDGIINFNHNNAAGSSTIAVGATADEFKSTAAGTVLANAITLASGAAPKIYATSGNSLEQTGEISGLGGLLRDDNGSGTIKFSGANIYSGGFKITSRTVRLNHKQALGTGTFTIGDSVTAPANAITITSDAVLTGADAVDNDVTLNQSFTLAAVNDLELSGDVAIKPSATPTITVNSGRVLTLSGVASGTASGLTKAGAGTLTLTGVNTYDGATAVSVGTLLVNSPGSLAAGSAVAVNGGTLGGNGTISGAITVNSGGTLAPGTSIGTLTLDSAPTLGGTLAMEINANDLTSDKLVLTSGTFTYGGTLALTVTAGTLVGGEVFNLFDESDAGDSTGSFTITTSPSLGAGLNWWQGNLATTGELILNRAPTGGSDTLSTATNTPANITVTKLKSQHPDADGDTMTFALPSGTTTALGTVSESSGTVTYTPPNATFDGADSFDYTLDDGRGGVTTITVNVTVGAGTAQGANSVLVFTDTAPDPDQFVVRFAGVPGVIYTVEHSTAATGPWSKLENKTAPTDNSLGFGIGVFEVRENIDAGGAGFYRTVHPSY